MKLGGIMIKIYFLGTNGWYDSNTGSTICTLIEHKDFYFILDAGNGFNKIDRYIILTYLAKDNLKISV